MTKLEKQCLSCKYSSIVCDSKCQTSLDCANCKMYHWQGLKSLDSVYFCKCLYIEDNCDTCSCYEPSEDVRVKSLIKEIEDEN